MRAAPFDFYRLSVRLHAIGRLRGLGYGFIEAARCAFLYSVGICFSQMPSSFCPAALWVGWSEQTESETQKNVREGRSVGDANPTYYVVRL